MKLTDYMNASFPGVILKPSIYDQWENHLHFDFGIVKYQLKNDSDKLNMNYFSQVYQYNKSLFQDVFSIEDTMFLVTNVYRMKENKSKNQKKIKVYNRYIKKKELKFHVKQETLPYMFEICSKKTKNMILIVHINFLYNAQKKIFDIFHFLKL